MSREVKDRLTIATDIQHGQETFPAKMQTESPQSTVKERRGASSNSFFNLMTSTEWEILILSTIVKVLLFPS